MESTINSAITIIKGMSKSFNLRTAKNLTVVCAVLAPPSCYSDVEGVNVVDFCNMIGVN